MLLKTERLPDFKVLADHTAQKPENCTFLILLLSLFLSFHGCTVHYTRMSAFVSLTYEHGSFEVSLDSGATPVLCVNVELVASVSTSPYPQSITTHHCTQQLLVLLLPFLCMAMLVRQFNEVDEDHTIAVLSQLALLLFAVVAAKRRGRGGRKIFAHRALFEYTTL